MGVVWKARDKRLNRIVALKFLLAGSDQATPALTRFQREAEAIAALNHPNVATSSKPASGMANLSSPSSICPAAR